MHSSTMCCCMVHGGTFSVIRLFCSISVSVQWKRGLAHEMEKDSILPGEPICAGKDSSEPRASSCHHCSTTRGIFNIYALCSGLQVHSWIVRLFLPRFYLVARYEEESKWKCSIGEGGQRSSKSTSTGVTSLASSRAITSALNNRAAAVRRTAAVTAVNAAIFEGRKYKMATDAKKEPQACGHGSKKARRVHSQPVCCWRHQAKAGRRPGRKAHCRWQELLEEGSNEVTWLTEPVQSLMGMSAGASV